MPIRYWHQHDELAPGGGLVVEDDFAWRGIAFAACAAALALTPTPARAFTYNDDVPSAAAPTVVEEDFYRPPAPWPTPGPVQQQRLDEEISFGLTQTLDEDVWKPSPALPQLPLAYVASLPPFTERDDFPALYGVPEEDSYPPQLRNAQPPVFPTPSTCRVLGDDEVLPITAVVFQPDEDYWQPPVPLPVAVPRVFAADDEVPWNTADLIGPWQTPGNAQAQQSYSGIGSVFAPGDAWGNVNIGAETTGQADPYGSNGASVLSDNATVGVHQVYFVTSILPAGRAYLATFLWKPGTYAGGAYFTADYGVSGVGVSNAGGVLATNGSASNVSVTSIGGGYFQVSFTFASTGGQTLYVQFGGSAVNTSYAGTGQNFYLDYASLLPYFTPSTDSEEGLPARPQAVATAPRVWLVDDDLPVAAVLLLVEEDAYRPPAPWPPTTARPVLEADDWVPFAGLPSWLDEDYWPPPVWPVVPTWTRAFTDADEIPAGGLYTPVFDEDAWRAPAPWQQAQPRPFTADDDLPVVAFTPDEDFWIVPRIWNSPPPPSVFVADDDRVPPLVPLPVDEFYWQNPVQPVLLSFTWFGAPLYLPDADVAFAPVSQPITPTPSRTIYIGPSNRVIRIVIPQTVYPYQPVGGQALAPDAWLPLAYSGGIHIPVDLTPQTTDVLDPFGGNNACKIVVPPLGVGISFCNIYGTFNGLYFGGGMPWQSIPLALWVRCLTGTAQCNIGDPSPVGTPTAFINLTPVWQRVTYIATEGVLYIGWDTELNGGVGTPGFTMYAYGAIRTDQPNGLAFRRVILVPPSNRVIKL
jgi:hypothetical protein